MFLSSNDDDYGFSSSENSSGETLYSTESTESTAEESSQSNAQFFVEDDEVPEAYAKRESCYGNLLLIGYF